MDTRTDRVSGWNRASAWIVNLGAGLFVLGMLYVLVDTYLLR